MNTKELILEKTDGGLHVFNYYIPIDFKPKRKFRNPLYDESKASYYIYKDVKSGKYLLHDFGNPFFREIVLVCYRH